MIMVVGGLMAAKLMIVSWSERMSSHNRIEKSSILRGQASVGNIEQWAEA